MTRTPKTLQEAYLSVYEPQEITEEVEIAAQYFYEQGLNEYGVEILIEELGLDEFVDFVYDIAEEYTLTEARRGGVRVEPVTKTGKQIGTLKGGAKAAAIRSRRKEKEARRESEEKASSEKPSDLSGFLRSTAVKTTKKSQPQTQTQKKAGIASVIGGALQAAGERAKKDTELLKKSWQGASDTKLAQLARIGLKKGSRAIEKHGHTAGSVAGRALGTAASATLRAGMRAGQSEMGQKIKKGIERAVTKEELEIWVDSLLDEGYDLSEYTWDDMLEIYEEAVELEEKKIATRTGKRLLSKKRRSRLAKRVRAGEDIGKKGKGFKKVAAKAAKFYGSKEAGERVAAAAMFKQQAKMHHEESYEYVLSYLLDEGYADTIEGAEKIASCMSEEWVDEILDEAEKLKKPAKMGEPIPQRMITTRPITGSEKLTGKPAPELKPGAGSSWAPLSDEEKAARAARRAKRAERGGMGSIRIG